MAHFHMGKDVVGTRSYVVGTRYYVVGMRLLCCENEILGRGNKLNIIFHMSPQCCRTFLYILGLFLKDKIQNWNIFGGLKISIFFFFWYADIPDILGGKQ